jgi:uncharacterized protein (TIGR02594 family)
MSQVATATASRTTPALQAETSGTYHIARGDTLSEIAQRHGTTVAALMQANPQIIDADRIYAGDSLQLPEGSAAQAQSAASGDVHLIRPGETLSQLAREYNTDVATLMRLNGLSNPNLIHAGDLLLLQPGGQAAPGATGAGPQTPGSGGSWMDIARGEMGQKEIAGGRDNPRIVEYHRSTSLRASNDETPWCSSFVNWTLEKAGYKGTDSAAAISWKDWGRKVDGLGQGRAGDVVVLRNKASGQNHVGFLDHAGGGKVTLLGGNQSNQVKLSSFNLGSYEVVAVRRPPGSDKPAATAVAAPAAGTGAKTGISEADYAAVAKELGVDVAAVKAVAQVESSGSGFLPSGRAKILFEAHVFHRETGGRHDGTHPNISSPRWNRALYGAGGEHQWQRYQEAAKLDPDAAMKSASWGRFQIMGFNHKAAGFADVKSFAAAMQRSEGEQLKAFGQFIKSNPKMLEALREHDWAGFASRYNGPGYAQNQYDSKLAQAYASFAH